MLVGLASAREEIAKDLTGFEKLSGLFYLIFIFKVFEWLNFLMNSDEVFRASKQAHQSISLQTRWDIGYKFVIGRVIPITKITFKFMLLWILMDVNNKT
jgi:hypothetical protein